MWERRTGHIQIEKKKKEKEKWFLCNSFFERASIRLWSFLLLYRPVELQSFDEWSVLLLLLLPHAAAHRRDENQRLSLSFKRKFPSRTFLMRCVNVQCLFPLIGAPRHLHKCQRQKMISSTLISSLSLILPDYSFSRRSVNHHDGIDVVPVLLLLRRRRSTARSSG